MKKIIHREADRGKVNHGWLKTNYSFSFASWYNPERINFGALRVLNDDYVEAEGGFPTHPHDNMEIITIPLKGKLEHKDSMGNGSVITAGEVQMMSAGSGVQHSEFNPSGTQDTNLLQIWIYPHEHNITPGYGQMEYRDEDLMNKIHTLITPSGGENNMTIHQNAWISLAKPEAGFTLKYRLNSKKNGVYVFLIEGKADAAEEKLSFRDAIGVWETDTFEVMAEQDSFLLFIEVPMEGYG